jgi:hypothetical protein
MSEQTPPAGSPASKIAAAQVAPAKADAAKAAVAGAPAKPVVKDGEKAKRGRTSELAGKKIFLVEAKIREKMPEGRTDLNPKREGSNGYKAFSLYKNGMLVEEFTKLAAEKKVGSIADIRWDKEHGFIELKD